ncbi:hypothetical protein GCM10027040_31560 [Halomonas shantousis]
MKRIGVLTGDVVGSQRIDDKALLHDTLEAILDILACRLDARGSRYRGDGFQIALPTPGTAVTAAVLVRASLIQYSPSRQQMWDARVAIGLGNGQMPDSGRFADADGEAFVLSGHRLDAMAHTVDRLAIVSPFEALNDDLSLLTRFADDLISHWSRYSAEVAYLSLLHEETQQILAKRLGRAQPTIHKRLAAARWPLIRDYLDYASRRIVEAMP